MTDKKLTDEEIMKNLKFCKDCLHFKACYEMATANGAEEFNTLFANKCEDFTAHSEWVHLPCKVGDTVYYTSGKYYNDIIKCIVVAIEQNEEGMIIKTHLWHHLQNIQMLQRVDKWFRKDDFFKIVFPTREEAEKALEEKK